MLMEIHGHIVKTMKKTFEMVKHDGSEVIIS
jgi:hypothetical protein